MKDFETHFFKIDALSPDTLSMKRLAEYLADLSKLLGNEENVHFMEVKKGSANLAYKIETHALPKVEQRIQSVDNSDSSSNDASKAWKDLNKKLKMDNAKGQIYRINKDGKKQQKQNILLFPGREAPAPVVFRVTKQQGHVDGEVIRVGGKDDTIPIHLQSPDGKIYTCQTKSKQIAATLGTQLYKYVRVYGEGNWTRDENDLWILENFTINRSEELPNLSLSEEVTSLYAINGLKKEHNLLADLRGEDLK